MSDKPVPPNDGSEKRQLNAPPAQIDATELQVGNLPRQGDVTRHVGDVSLVPGAPGYAPLSDAVPSQLKNGQACLDQLARVPAKSLEADNPLVKAASFQIAQNDSLAANIARHLESIKTRLETVQKQV